MTIERPSAWLTAVPRSHLVVLAIALLVAVGARIAFWVVTDRVWEDALITLAHVRNLREGIGLTHHPGEGLVHGFTSALSVLIPLAGELLLPDSGLTALRLASLAAAAAAIACGFAIARHLHLSVWATAFVLAYLAVNQNQIFYGMAGMETQVATALLLAGALSVVRGHERLAGAVAGAAVLARPDMLLWAGLVMVWAARRGPMSLARVAIPAAIVVVPWIAFTTTYYGSPIPQTIVAKSVAYTMMPEAGAAADAWLQWAAERVPLAAGAVLRMFTPFYEDGMTVAAPIDAGWLAIVGLALVALTIRGVWLSLRVPDWWPVPAYLAAFLSYWVVALPLGYFTWYQPPFMALCAIHVGIALDRLPIRGRLMPAVASAVLAGSVAVHLPFSMPLDAAVQRDVELGVRRTTGLVLAEVVQPGEAVVAEAAGYLGWYSRVTLWDHPGLTSPTALAAVRALPRAERDVIGLSRVLRPAWLALRPAEWRELEQRYPATADCYVLEETVGTDREPVVELNGLARWNPDWGYLVLQRRGGCAA